jgi:hypothetical protein
MIDRVKERRPTGHRQRMAEVARVGQGYCRRVGWSR